MVMSLAFCINASSVGLLIMRQPAVITSASTNSVPGLSFFTPLEMKKRSRSSTPTRPLRRRDP